MDTTKSWLEKLRTEIEKEGRLESVSAWPLAQQKPNITYYGQLVQWKDPEDGLNFGATVGLRFHCGQANVSFAVGKDQQAIIVRGASSTNVIGLMDETHTSQVFGALRSNDSLAAEFGIRWDADRATWISFRICCGQHDPIWHLVGGFLRFGEVSLGAKLAMDGKWHEAYGAAKLCFAYRDSRTFVEVDAAVSYHRHKAKLGRVDQEHCWLLEFSVSLMRLKKLSASSFNTNALQPMIQTILKKLGNVEDRHAMAVKLKLANHQLRRLRVLYTWTKMIGLDEATKKELEPHSWLTCCMTDLKVGFSVGATLPHCNFIVEGGVKSLLYVRGVLGMLGQVSSVKVTGNIDNILRFIADTFEVNQPALDDITCHVKSDKGNGTVLNRQEHFTAKFECVPSEYFDFCLKLVGSWERGCHVCKIRLNEVKLRYCKGQKPAKSDVEQNHYNHSLRQSTWSIGGKGTITIGLKSFDIEANVVPTELIEGTLPWIRQCFDSRFFKEVALTGKLGWRFEKAPVVELGGRVTFNRSKHPSLPEYVELKGSYDAGDTVVQGRIEKWDPFLLMREDGDEHSILKKLLPQFAIEHLEVDLHLGPHGIAGLKKLEILAVFYMGRDPKQQIEDMFEDAEFFCEKSEWETATKEHLECWSGCIPILRKASVSLESSDSPSAEETHSNSEPQCEWWLATKKRFDIRASPPKFKTRNEVEKYFQKVTWGGDKVDEATDLTEGQGEGDSVTVESDDQGGKVIPRPERICAVHGFITESGRRVHYIGSGRNDRRENGSNIRDDKSGLVEGYWRIHVGLNLSINSVLPPPFNILSGLSLDLQVDRLTLRELCKFFPLLSVLSNERCRFLDWLFGFEGVSVFVPPIGELMNIKSISELLSNSTANALFSRVMAGQPLLRLAIRRMWCCKFFDRYLLFGKDIEAVLLLDLGSQGGGLVLSAELESNLLTPFLDVRLHFYFGAEVYIRDPKKTHLCLEFGGKIRLLWGVLVEVNAGIRLRKGDPGVWFRLNLEIFFLKLEIFFIVMRRESVTQLLFKFAFSIGGADIDGLEDWTPESELNRPAIDLTDASENARQSIEANLENVAESLNSVPISFWEKLWNIFERKIAGVDLSGEIIWAENKRVIEFKLTFWLFGIEIRKQWTKTWTKESDDKWPDDCTTVPPDALPKELKGEMHSVVVTFVASWSGKSEDEVIAAAKKLDSFQREKDILVEQKRKSVPQQHKQELMVGLNSEQAKTIVASQIDAAVNALPKGTRFTGYKLTLDVKLLVYKADGCMNGEQIAEIALCQVDTWYQDNTFCPTFVSIQLHEESYIPKDYQEALESYTKKANGVLSQTLGATNNCKLLSNDEIENCIRMQTERLGRAFCKDLKRRVENLEMDDFVVLMLLPSEAGASWESKQKKLVGNEKTAVTSAAIELFQEWCGAKSDCCFSGVHVDWVCRPRRSEGDGLLLQSRKEGISAICKRWVNALDEFSVVDEIVMTVGHEEIPIPYTKDTVRATLEEDAIRETLRTVSGYEKGKGFVEVVDVYFHLQHENICDESGLFEEIARICDYLKRVPARCTGIKLDHERCGLENPSADPSVLYPAAVKLFERSTSKNCRVSLIGVQSYSALLLPNVTQFIRNQCNYLHTGEKFRLQLGFVQFKAQADWSNLVEVAFEDAEALETFGAESLGNLQDKLYCRYLLLRCDAIQQPPISDAPKEATFVNVTEEILRQAAQISKDLCERKEECISLQLTVCADNSLEKLLHLDRPSNSVNVIQTSALTLWESFGPVNGKISMVKLAVGDFVGSSLPDRIRKETMKIVGIEDRDKLDTLRRAHDLIWRRRFNKDVVEMFPHGSREEGLSPAARNRNLFQFIIDRDQRFGHLPEAEADLMMLTKQEQEDTIRQLIDLLGGLMDLIFEVPSDTATLCSLLLHVITANKDVAGTVWRLQVESRRWLEKVNEFLLESKTSEAESGPRSSSLYSWIVSVSEKDVKFRERKNSDFTVTRSRKPQHWLSSEKMLLAGSKEARMFGTYKIATNQMRGSDRLGSSDSAKQKRVKESLVGPLLIVVADPTDQMKAIAMAALKAASAKQRQFYLFCPDGRIISADHPLDLSYLGLSSRGKGMLDLIMFLLQESLRLQSPFEKIFESVRKWHHSVGEFEVCDMMVLGSLSDFADWPDYAASLKKFRFHAIVSKSEIRGDKGAQAHANLNRKFFRAHYL